MFMREIIALMELALLLSSVIFILIKLCAFMEDSVVTRHESDPKSRLRNIFNGEKSRCMQIIITIIIKENYPQIIKAIIYL